MSGIGVRAVEGIGEILCGADLAALVGDIDDLADGDIVAITSKVVSKAEGRTVIGEREAAIEAETVRVVARRGATSIVANRLGVVMAAAGVDASNVASGTVVLLPVAPDRSARTIREQVYAETGRNVAVLISDTAGRPWREGQTDIAIGLAGIEPLQDFSGAEDGYGNTLAVTAPAVADELAGIAEVVTGKLGGRPLAVISGLADRVLPPGEHGAGAAALIRESETDMFGLGSREAVFAAVAGRDQRFFGTPTSAHELIAALSDCGFAGLEDGTGRIRVELSAQNVPTDPRPGVLAWAYGWRVVNADSGDRCIVLARLS